MVVVCALVRDASQQGPSLAADRVSDRGPWHDLPVESLAERITSWLARVDSGELAAHEVPGATQAERRQLSALGALAWELHGGPPTGWPAQLLHWAAVDVEVPGSLLEEVRKALDDDTDILAAIYEHVVAGPNRRHLGTFFTPPDVVKHMIALVRSSGIAEPEVIADPGAGVGAFSVEAARAWPDSRVLAVDTNVVTLGLLGVRTHHEGLTDRVELVRSDYLKWITNPGSRPRPPTLYLGNPPYTRHQTLDPATKDSAAEAAGELIDSRLAGLAAYFTAATIRSLRPEDAMCLVLPASWAEATYGRRMRDWIWAETGRAVTLEYFPTNTEVFPGTRVAAMVMMIGPRASAVQPLIVARLDRSGTTISRKDHRVVERDGAVPTSLGTSLLATGAAREPGPGLVPLSAIARIRRGVATGANEFFLVDDKRLVELGSPPAVAALRRLRHVTGDELDETEHERIGADGHPRWLLVLRADDVRGNPLIGDYIAVGERKGYSSRYLCQVRDTWYEVEHVDPPDIVVSPMSKGPFRVVLNTVRAVPSNSMYGIYLSDPSTARGLVDWLNSSAGQAELEVCARHYSHGLRKLEPGSYRKVLIPIELAAPSVT